MVRLKDEIHILRSGELKHRDRGVRSPHLVPQAYDLVPGKPSLRFHGIVEDNDRHSLGKEALRYHPVEVLFVVCREYEYSLVVTERHNCMTDQRITAEQDDGLAGLFRRSVGPVLSVQGLSSEKKQMPPARQKKNPGAVPLLSGDGSRSDQRSPFQKQAGESSSQAGRGRQVRDRPR